MFKVLSIDHAVLRAIDVSRMLRFYGEVLGRVLERQLDEYGLFQLRAGRSLIDLVDVKGPIGREAKS
jgi:catechol 2,3-dioxygenase-like lactoylglutathione lyase family enzyme